MSDIRYMNYSLLLNEDILNDLGKRFKEHRINSRFTQEELARKSGVSRRTISGLENGKYNISLKNLIDILRALQLINNLQDLLPELPAINPIEMAKLENKRTQRIRKK